MPCAEGDGYRFAPLPCLRRYDLRILAARHARGLLEVCPPKVRGRRECRAPAGTRSRVQDALRNAHTSIQVQPEQPGIPCAMVLQLMPRSPWRRIPLASIASELTARIARLGFANLRQLHASHGRQDHTVLPYAASRHQLRPAKCMPAEAMTKAFKRRSSARRARSRITALQTPFALDAAASTATRPNVRDDGQRPSSRDGMAGVVGVIWGLARSGIFLRTRTGQGKSA